MKIFIDARYLRSSFSGIATYSEKLLQAIGALDHRNQYKVLVHSSYRGDLDLPENFEILQDDAPPVSLRTLLTLQNLIRPWKPDVVHSLMPLWPITMRNDFRTVATIFDLQPLLDPYFTSGRSAYKRRAYDIFYNITYRACMTQSDYLVAISAATKRDIATVVPKALDHTLVIHPGFDPDIQKVPPDDQIARVKEKYDLPDRYVLYLGSTRPNKNLTCMLDGFEELLCRHPEEENLRWVMVLKPDRFFDPFFTTIRRKGLLRRIHIFDQVTELEKKVFYAQAQLLYFATKFEGFGLPVLEAQGMGVPVLASTHGSLPEVTGRGGILVNPDDKNDIADGLEELLYNQALRTEVVEQGYQNVKRFSWENAARETLNMYEHLLK